MVWGVAIRCWALGTHSKFDPTRRFPTKVPIVYQESCKYKFGLVVVRLRVIVNNKCIYEGKRKRTTVTLVKRFSKYDRQYHRHRVRTHSG